MLEQFAHALYDIENILDESPTAIPAANAKRIWKILQEPTLHKAVTTIMAESFFAGDPDRDPAASRQHERQTRHSPTEEG